MKRRVLSFIVTLMMCLNLFPVWAFAADVGTDDGLCSHHPAHTDACGYAPPVLERECAHSHDDGCYTAETNCIHEHTAGCYSEDGSGSGGPALCAHTCTPESGCVTQVLSCPHRHDDTCGYAEGSPGAPCTFVCPICPIEDLISRLPRSVSAQNAEQVQARLGEIYALYDALTEEEQQQVDLSPCAALLEQMDGMGAAALSDGPDSVTETYTLTADTNRETPYVVDNPRTTITTNKYTLTGMKTSAIQVTKTGELYLTGGGAVISKSGAGIEVQSGGFLSIMDPDITVQGTTYALDIASGAAIHLSAGTYSGGIAAIRVQGDDFGDLFEPGYTCFDATGNRIPPEAMATAKSLTVGPCTDHSDRTCTHDAGTTTHTWTCSACKITGSEPCTFAFAGNETGICSFCGNEITVAVDRDSLKALAYDDTVKPANGTVTVGVKDAAAALTEDTDYTVSYATRAEVGDASFTVTVTVTGKTYNGTFTQDYTFTKDELEKPILEWDSTSGVSVPYTGSPVTTGHLPPVTINISTSSGVDLHGQLQYSYREQGSGAYMKGLPTNAGIYDVVVSLPEGPDYQAASSDPITLTIEKINPIAAAPAATTPVYNGAAQALVTAGTLDPVAVGDGLEIQFAPEENGAYSAAIPTGTNAGDSYRVWYKVDGLTGNYIAPNPNPAEVTGVAILRRPLTPKVTLSEYTYLYDGGYKQPKVTVKDEALNAVLPDTEYTVAYVDNQDVSTADHPAKVVVTDKAGGNYDITRVEEAFQITLRTQAALSITNQPNTVTYGDRFTLGTSGGSGNGLVTWKITAGGDVAEVDEDSGEVTVIGDGSATVQATKSGTDPATGKTNYEDATAVWTLTARKKPVTATVTAEDKTYNGNNIATVHAVVEQGVLPGDEITITGLTGVFDNANAGTNKTVTVDTTNAAINGNNSEHYAVSYSSTTVKAAIHKAVAKITTVPVAATLTYNGTAQALITTGAVVDPNTVQAEYALSEEGPYSANFPKGTGAGTYTVWYRVVENDNYTGEPPAQLSVTIAKKPVSPTITLDQDTFVYDGTAKEPVVTLKEADGTTIIPDNEYTVAYSGNINVGTATVTVTAKADGNYAFTPDLVTKNFTITEKQAEVLTAPEAAGLPLTFNTYAQRLVTAGVASGGTMVYCVGAANGTYSEDIPTETNAGSYTVYYKVAGDANHSDSAVGQVSVTIAPKRVDNPTIELFQANDTPLVSYTYDGSAKEPKAVVKDGSMVIDVNEYEIRYDNNIDAGNTATVNIIGKSGGNYDVTGSKTFVIQKADIVFNPAPSAANITYDGKAHELLVPGTTSGGTVQYALGSATSTYSDAIPTGTNAGTYTVYYKVVGDKNHNDLNDLANQKVDVTIQRKPLTGIIIALTPASFEYDGNVKLPAVTVKDGDTVLPTSEYTWACDNNAPTQGGTYTITVSDKDGGNYDLTGVVAPNNTETFTIGKAAQAELVIEGKPEQVYYGDIFKLSTSGGSGTGGFTWTAVGGNADIDADGNVTIKGVGPVTISVVKAGDTNYEQTSDQWTFTAAPKPVTATVTVSGKPYDGNTTAAVASASITTINSDTVTIDPASITAAFDTPHAGTDKTVTLDTSKVQVTGDTAKYAIRYPDTVTADITQATTTITTNPAAIAPLTYSGQPQTLVTAGQTNVGFLVYALDGTGFSPELPTGTNAGTYSVYYRVDETDDYTGIAVNGTPVSVTIGPKTITPTVELSESSFLYDGTTKSPIITVKDGKTVIDPDQYTFTWANDDSSATGELLTAAGKYTATITSVAGGNYSFTAAAHAEIKAATQSALDITGTPDHVYYGDTVTTLKTTGGSGNGTVEWSITAGGDSAEINSATGVLTVKGTGSVTVKAERTVPNYAPATDTWTFTVEPKPVVAEVTIAPKSYDGTTGIADTAITAVVKTGDLVNGDTVTLTGLKGVYEGANAGTGKTVTLNAANATKADGSGKYAVSYPAAAKGDINPRQVDVAVTLSGNDLQGNATDGYSYTFDGTEKTPAVTVAGTDGAYSAALAASDYSVSITDNKNVGNATVTVTAKAGGNYTFNDTPVQFAIKKANAALTSSPQGKDLTYDGTAQELVTVGAATGGTVVYSRTGADGSYLETIPQETDAGTYTVYYKVKGDGNHEDTAPGQVSAAIKPKEITPAITLSQTTYVYDGTAKTPTVTVQDDTDTIGATEYSVSYRDNMNVGTATVTVSDANGGNYIVNGTANFAITKAAPTVTAPTAIPGLQYNGASQDLVNAGVTSHGTVVYSVNGGNDSAVIPAASAVGTYTVNWKVLGDANHSDTTPAALTVNIDKNTVTNPTITLSSDTFKYNGSQQKPTITVYDGHSRVIPEHEYTVAITGTNGDDMVNVGTYTVKITTPADSNYVIADDGTVNNTRTFKIVEADQEAISITGTKAQVCYGDTIQLGTSGGSGGGTITWAVAANDNSRIASTISGTGLLTVKDVNTPITVTVTCSKGGNYNNVSATWEFTAGKKPVTAVLTGVDRNYTAGDTSATVTASVPNSELVSGDSITISGLTGTFDDPNVGTNKKVTVNSSSPTVTGTNSEKYDITYPATATASILGVAATVNTAPAAAASLTYDASQAQALVTAGTAAGGIMVYSLDGVNFTPSIPKAKDAGAYTVYYKAQGDQNHTDSAVGTVVVTIAKQTVTPQIELSPPSAQYDGSVKRPESVTVRDTANNIIPASEYTVVYDSATNWKDVGKHKVKVQNVTGGNYSIMEAEAEFEISTTAQNPLEIVNKPGLIYYGDTFTLSATGGSGNEKVTWSSSDTSIAEIDANGFVKIVGVGSATITATKAGGGNYNEATATYPLNALQKPVTAIVTAEDRVYASGDTSATIHVTWEKGALVGTDSIDMRNLSGTFADDQVGTGKTVTITGTPVSDTTAQKYDITIPPTTTASIFKADAMAPNVTGNTLTYNGSAQALVNGGDANTLYSASRDGVYTAAVPTGTNAGSYTVWYKEQGDANHNASEPQAIQVTISRKQLALTDANVTVELSGNDLQKEADGTYYYEYDGSEKKPSVIINDGAAAIPASEYTVVYSDNKNVSTADKKATVTITDSGDGNYDVSGSVTFEIRKGGAQLTGSPQARDLTYTGQPQELVTVGTATGGHIEYSLDGGSYGKDIPKADLAKTYTVTYKVVGDDNHEDNPTVGSVTVTIKQKEVISPKVTVTGTYTYDGTPKEPAAADIKVEDGTTTIPASEYEVDFRDNVDAGTAAVIITNANGGNYIVNGTGTFIIARGAASVAEAPKGLENLPYNGAEQALAEAGSATGGTMVYSLSETGEYSPAIPTGKAVSPYTVWYKVQGDSNHTDTEPQSVTASIIVNNVTNPTIQVTPESVTYNGKKQEPTVTVKDGSGLLIDGSEYEVTYKDTTNNNTDLTAVGTYTVTITGVTNGNYTFDATAGKNTATFEILPADQTALTITGTRERVYYGDTIQLGTTGGIDGGTVTWKVNDGAPASIDAGGLLKITGVGSVTVTATSTKTGYADQSATWPIYAEKKPVTAVVTAAAKDYDGVTPATTTVTATLQNSDLVGSDSITITLAGRFEDANAGTDKKVIVDSTNPQFSADSKGHANYLITYPDTTTASIFKAAVTNVTAPTAASGLVYTGLPQALVTAGSSTEGALEYSLDGKTYSASLPTGTGAGDYEVWYRVKGDGNHKDTEGTKLGSSVIIGRQEVTDPTVELTPNSVSYDGKEHKPEVTVKDNNNRVIPADEYTFEYGTGDWTKAGTYTVKVTGKTGGNYDITEKEQAFTILVAGQSPLSITNKPGKVQYGDTFTLSAVGGSITGTVTWSSSAPEVASIGGNGLVTVHKSGSVTITAKKLADGNYGEVSDTWSFSAEKKPVTAIVTANDKVYDTTDTATLVISWKDGDLLGNDSIAFTPPLTGRFNNANVGDNKPVTISGDVPASDKYTISYNQTTTASITPAAASVTAPTPLAVVYSGQPQSLVSAGAAANGTITYSLDGIVYGPNIPQGTNAGSYTVWYKVTGNENYKDIAPNVVPVTINPKTVSSPTIELSPETFDYDGTPKRPDVVVKDGNVVIPASEYTVSYSNNTAVGTATVTISDASGGNYNVSGSKTFTIKAGAPALTAEPQPRVLTYNGRQQTLVTRGTAVNGHMEYSFDEYDDYSTTLPKETNAGIYEVWYKVVSSDGTAETEPESVIAEIQPKQVSNPTVTVNLTSDPLPYTGTAQKPPVTVVVDGNTLTKDVDYTVTYSNNINAGTATVAVQSVSGGNYQFYTTRTFEIAKSKAAFAVEPKGKDNLRYTGEALELFNAGLSLDGIVLYSKDTVTYTADIPTGINVGTYTFFAKVRGDSKHEDSDPIIIKATIGQNVVTNPGVTLSQNSFTYTGGEHKPTVTVTDDNGNVIPASEYTVTYSGNINVGQATVTIASKGSNYSFTAETHFQITSADQPALIITGKPDRICYGDTITTLRTEGGSGTVTWSVTGGTSSTIDQTTGRLFVKDAGAMTVTATSGSMSDTWTFYVNPKPVTAVVTAANKVYDGSNTAALTVTLSGLVSGDNIATNTDDGVKAAGQFTDETVGTNKTVLITSLTVPAAVSEKYDISYNSTTTASITPKPAEVQDANKPMLAGSLTYNGSAQALLASGGTADGGNLMYSLDGRDYSYTIPTGTDAKTYTVWYKVEAVDDNHKDSAPVKLGDVTIAPNVDNPRVLCTPATVQYDGTEKTPDVVVRDSANRIIPEGEYTVAFEPGTRIAVGKYKVTVTDKPGGNYEFASPVSVADAFEIVPASQNPLSIITDKPTDVSYGETFRLSAMGGSGSGAIHWSIAESGVATINANGVVTVTGTGGFTVEAYREASDGYGQSNTASVPFAAKPKSVTPVVTASDKPYDGKTDATLTASWKSGDLAGGDTITLTVSGAFATADAGTGKRVSVIGNATGTDATLAKYAITWPDSTTASIYKVDAKLDTAPAGADLTYTGSAQVLVTGGSTVDGIGKVEYSTSQNGAYSETIPTGTNAGTYFVWYKVADSVNYTGIAPASIQVEIKKADPTVTANPTASGTAGQTLSQIQLNGGATDVSGTFAWKDGSFTPAVGTSQQVVVFTPKDKANYNTHEFSIDVTIEAASDGYSADDSGTSANSTPMRTTVQNGTASTVLSASAGSELVRAAAANQSQNIVIKPEIASDVTRTQVSIPASTVSQIQSETSAALTVSAPIADVTIPNAALNTLSSAGGTVDVVTEQVDQGVVLTLTAGGETVEKVPGGVTLTVPAEDAGPGTVAVLVNDDGTREIIQKSVAEEGKMNIPLSGSATVEIVDNSKTFDDVPPTSWAAEAITFASARELFNGTDETTFSPEETTTRGMVAAVLYRLEGQPEQSTENAYSDVSGDAWYADSIAWAAENGIVNGYGDGQFGPNDSVTREQFVVMLWRYVGSPEAKDRDLAFTDADQVNSYALEALCWAVENGVLSGNGSGQLVPGGTATRAEAAQMLKNFMENT